MAKKWLWFGSLLSMLFLFTGCTSTKSFNSTLTAQKVDLPRYLGTWYEIARIPNWFEKDLVGVTATYSLKKDGQVEVRNEGYLKSISGDKKIAIGNARIPDTKELGRLKVSFFWFIEADYIIFELDPNYQYALVGSDKDYLWVLSRTPHMEDALFQTLLAKATVAGYDASRLEKVLQPAN